MTHRILVAGLVVVFAAIAATLGYQSLASSSSTAASPIDVRRREHPTFSDDGSGAVGNLDPGLVGALRQAAS